VKKMNNQNENWSIPLQAALEKIQEHNLSAALEILLEAVDYEQTNIRLINLLADCYYYLGELDRAEACWEEVLSLNPRNQEAKNKLGCFKTPSFQSWIKRYKDAIYYIEQKDYVAALKSLRELMEENDGFVSIYQFLGLCYMACSEPEQAMIVWKKGLELDTSNEMLSRYLQIIPEGGEEMPDDLEKQKELPESQIKSSLHFPIHKVAGAAAAVLCMALLVKGGMMVQYDSTINNIQEESLAAVIELNESEIVQEKTAVISSNMLMAEEDGKGGSDYDLEREEFYYHEGYQAYLDGNLNKARTNLNMVVSMNAGDYLNREALYYLARTYYIQNEYEQAEKYYLQYLDEFPGSNYYDDTLFYLGAIYNATGEKEKAVEALREMQKNSPNSGYESSELFKKIMSSLDQS